MGLSIFVVPINFMGLLKKITETCLLNFNFYL